MEATVDALAAIVEDAVAAERAANVALAQRTRALARAVEWQILSAQEARDAGQHRVGGWDARTVARRTVSSSVAIALGMPERTAEGLIEAAAFLVASTPRVASLLDAGDISYRHAQVVADQGYGLRSDVLPDYDRRLAEVAADLTVAQLRDRARRLAESLQADTLTERASVAREQRRVEVEPARDGMAWLSAFLPAEQALGIHARLTDTAEAPRRDCPDDDRTLGQLRADAFADLLLEGEVAGHDVAMLPVDDGGTWAFDPFPLESDTAWRRGIRPRVLVTVPVMTLLGHDDLTGSLDGYGPIPADVARKLAAGAPSFTRLLTHPEAGTVLSVGRDRYAVPADLRNWLQIRDGTCRYPGCRTPASRSDIDHTHDWQFGGGTDYDNLAYLCRACHNLKHQTPTRSSNWATAGCSGPRRPGTPASRCPSSSCRRRHRSEASASRAVEALTATLGAPRIMR